MGLRKITADQIFTNTSGIVTHKVIILDEANKILAIEDTEKHDLSSVEILKGALVPGYVNAHCHMELSHMLGKIPSGTGLLGFIKDVVTRRNVNSELIREAIIHADQEMLANGIVAVGDISNTTDTFNCKMKSEICYYTFVEMFDFNNESLTNTIYKKYKAVYDHAPTNAKNQKSAVPHASYSVSELLFEKINQLNQGLHTVSIHNMETQAEIDFFKFGKGGFPSLFKTLGIEISRPTVLGKSPMDYLISNLDSESRTLFVHNTLVEEQDIRAAQEWNSKVYWASCPNANLYIENRLPNYQLFLNQDAKVCLGTDSLSSNWQLSIFEEMRTISKYQSYISTEELVKWSSLHGAEALGLQDTLGTIEAGKQPGLNLINLDAKGSIDRSSMSIRVI